MAAAGRDKDYIPLPDAIAVGAQKILQPAAAAIQDFKKGVAVQPDEIQRGACVAVGIHKGGVHFKLLVDAGRVDPIGSQKLPRVLHIADGLRGDRAVCQVAHLA